MAREDQVQQTDYDSGCINQALSYDEVSNAIDAAKMQKAYLTIPNEALKKKMQKQSFIVFSSFVLYLDWAPLNGTIAA